MIRFWQYTEELFSQPFMDENVLSILYFLKSHNHTSVRKGPKGEFKIYVHVIPCKNMQFIRAYFHLQNANIQRKGAWVFVIGFLLYYSKITFIPSSHVLSASSPSSLALDREDLHSWDKCTLTSLPRVFTSSTGVCAVPSTLAPISIYPSLELATAWYYCPQSKNLYDQEQLFLEKFKTN